MNNFSTSQRSYHLDKSLKIKKEIKPLPFTSRHIGPDDKEIETMLNYIGVKNLDELMKKAIPSNILHPKELIDKIDKQLGNPVSENAALEYLRDLSNKNELFKNYIGLGFNPCVTPPSILINVLLNPNWLTSYTPYQSEISQGRLEALVNYQTLISELTGMDIANASLLDEGSSAAEAMYMAHNIHEFSKEKNKFFVDKNIYPYIKKVIKTKAHFQNIEIVEGDYRGMEFDNRFFGGIVQNPNNIGDLTDYTNFVKKMKKIKGISIIDCDIASLLLAKTPKEMGFDIAIGSSQRFGIPLMNGGPHCGFFACNNEHRRKMPGRIIGISKDIDGNPAYRLALQTREQHIRRNKATSNICTAQALIANVCGFYAMYHGKDGLINISKRICKYTHYLLNILKNDLGFKVISKPGKIFDTILIELDNKDEVGELMNQFKYEKINIRNYNKENDPDNANKVSITLNETTSLGDLEQIIKIFYRNRRREYDGRHFNIKFEQFKIDNAPIISEELQRNDKDQFLSQDIFHNYKSEHQLVRYIKTLENKDISLTNSMVPLGSCTLKLNPSASLLPVFWPKFTDIHPFAPTNQKEGYVELINQTNDALAAITQLDYCVFQPNSGATGEYSGLLTIRRYQESMGEGYKNICLIPNSAHGTNFASAQLAGLKVVTVQTDEKGNISLEDTKRNLEKYKDNFSCMMITYPSTHGVYEQNIKEISDLVHKYKGQLYLDGANMNAQILVTSPGYIGADVCHLNLHKSFALPHGGGGPGIGPIVVKKHLKNYVPGGLLNETQIAAGPYGSIGFLPIAWMYIYMMGKDLKKATQLSVLNSNYMMKRLEPYYPIVYKGKNGMCAHEFMIDINKLKKESGISEEDIAKRLMDYGFHAPTMSFPVHGTLMIEPTESEPKEEIDYFCDSMIKIREEIQEVIDGKQDKEDNVLKNAPHTMESVLKKEWNHKYTREKAAFPMGYSKRKAWPTARRVDNVYGDLHLITKCLH